MSDLSEAIRRSFSTTERFGDDSPMRVLGRRQLSGYEVFAQSIATTAPVASMVVVPVMLLSDGGGLPGLLTLALVFLGTVLAALCIAQFTRRMISPGGLYSFAFQGLGSRGAMMSGAALLLKYVGSASMTLYNGSLAALAVAAHVGLPVDGLPLRLAVCVVIGAALLAALIRGVKVAAVVILCIEGASLLFIVGLMLFAGEPGSAAEVPAASGFNSLPFWLTAVFCLAGFESATFLGSEAKRPYVTVTRAVIWTPLICGGLFLIGGWAAFTGRADPVVEVYLYGSSSRLSDVTAVLLQTAFAFSWLASSMASSNAASRLLFTMGLDRVIPTFLGRVHARFRTPSAALVVSAGLSTAISVLLLGGGSSWLLPHLQPMARAGILLAYLLTALAALRRPGRRGD